MRGFGRRRGERLRNLIWVLIVVAGFACIVALKVARHSTYGLHLKTYFGRGHGLQAGAPVRVDGVGVGLVTSVQIRPELGERPIEVLMQISTSYQLQIPNDSTVSLASDGLLGPTFPNIDTRNSHGSPIADNGVLNSAEPTDTQGDNAIKHPIEDAGDALRQTMNPNSPKGVSKAQAGGSAKTAAAGK